MTELFIQVAVPSPLRQTFDYLPPASSPVDRLQPGVRVQVPFGNRRLIGFIAGTSAETDFPRDKIKRAEKIIDQEPVLDAEVMSLYQWAAGYYQFPLGQALQTSLPAHIRKGLPAEEKKTRYWQLTDAGKTLDTATLNRAPRQLKLLQLFSEHEKLSGPDINVLMETPAGPVIRALEEKGLLETTAGPEPLSRKTRDETLYAQDRPLQLNSEQQQALTEILANAGSFNAFLLEGITGSGKTEIYLQVIAHVLAEGKQVLVLVPEISLTPQTIRRFENRFNREIVAFHSGLTDNQRLSAWLRAKSGKADIIIGTRSAIFTPLARPGLIIVDEEHDSSYKQQEGFRYSGRDLAIYRARQLHIPVILGSATPSLESLNNALSSRYHYLRLTERAGAASHPDYLLLDLKDQTLTEGFSGALIDIIASHLKQGNQVLIFLNRRGFAPILLCRHCGWIATCPRCDTSYTLHQHPPRLSCHHCESQKPVFRQCPECSSIELAAMGLGTERTEQTLKALFPATPVYRIDRDSTRIRDALQDILDKVDSGDPCLLVGTQMLSKGHHFPNVTLVAVLDADSGLFSADFRGQEHMGQLLTQVAGRAGRGETSGEVVIQTYNSTHPTLRALIDQGYGPFARKLLEERKLGKLPPFTYFVLMRAEASSRALPEKFLSAIKEAALASGAAGKISILGPMPSPMEKKGGLFRAQLILEGGKRPLLQRAVADLLPLLERNPDSRKVRWSVDVDPVDFT